MKYFKFYTFGDVEVAVFKCENDNEDSAIMFIAVSDLGQIEAMPSFPSEEIRDEAWENNTESISKSIAQMVEEAFEEQED